MYRNKIHAYKTHVWHPEMVVGRGYTSCEIMALCGVSTTFVFLNDEDPEHLISVYGLIGFTIVPERVDCNRCTKAKAYSLWELKALEI